MSDTDATTISEIEAELTATALAEDEIRPEP